MHTLDIFTRDIIQNSLQAIADEMFVAMRKAAMSPIIYEVLDMGTGITVVMSNLPSSLISQRLPFAWESTKMPG